MLVCKLECRVASLECWFVFVGCADTKVTHLDGATIQLYRSDGTLHPWVGPEWAAKVNVRYAQFHCGGIQTVMRTCTLASIREAFFFRTVMER